MKSKYLMIGAAVCAALFLFSGIMLWRQYADEKQSAEAFEQVAALVETEPAPTDTPQETELLPELTAFEKYRAVQEQNSDFVGWLSIPGTNIDYPVMQTVDEPNFYLKRGFDKQYSDYGVPYVQENCDLALSDNCVIYGHHMNNGTMFNNVTKFLDEDFFNSTNITIYTLDGIYTYEPFAIFETISTFQYFRMRFQDDADFVSFCEKMQEQSLYNKNMKFTGSDHIITLSTCTNSFTSTGRYALHAKLIKVEK